MKKNLLIYILLIVLVVLNGTLLYLYLDKPKRPLPGGGGPGHFITKELAFSEAQMQQFQELEKGFRDNMREISREARRLKNQLFDGITEERNAVFVDSMTRLIGANEAQRDALVFYHFRDIESLCDGEQKEKFARIVSRALRKNAPPKRP